LWVYVFYSEEERYAKQIEKEKKKDVSRNNLNNQ
jgi:hypothetical protein